MSEPMSPGFPAAPPILDDRPPQRSHWTQWLAVILFFGLLIFAQLKEYGDTQAAPVVKDYFQESMEFRLALQQKSLLESAGQTSTEVSTSMKKMLTELREEKKPGPRNLLLQYAIRVELGEKLTDAELKKLDTKDALVKTAKPIFEPGQFKREQAFALKPKLEEYGLLGKVLYREALRKAGQESYKAVFSAGQVIGMGAVLLMGLGAFFCGLAGWAFYFMLRKQLPKPEHPLPVMEPHSGGLVAVVAVVILGCFYLFSLAAGLMPTPSENVGAAVQAIAGLAFIGLLVYALARANWDGKSLLQALHRPHFSTGKLIGFGFLGFCMNLPVLVALVSMLEWLLRKFPASHPATELLHQNPSALALISLFISAAVVAPIWEEIAFRGFLFRGIAVSTKSWVLGLALSSLIFAAIHPQGPALILMLGWIGFMGGLLTVTTRSIVPAIVMHAIHNGFIVILSTTILS